jgi:hypothetical protein
MQSTVLLKTELVIEDDKRCNQSYLDVLKMRSLPNYVRCDGFSVKLFINLHFSQIQPGQFCAHDTEGKSNTCQVSL